jgi:hypothetical protein
VGVILPLALIGAFLLIKSDRIARPAQPALCEVAAQLEVRPVRLAIDRLPRVVAAGATFGAPSACAALGIVGLLGDGRLVGQAPIAAGHLTG